ncbi:metalloprotease [Cellulophaga sp. F20128]|uniref:metalloprotease n=1 Tax=Cellulophaga sp. F20128 TaxID=2926413 RepID=UPI001FF2A56B|nr:metalloprotease [Cellulophaga sp. F20128]MCK0156732.1 metalloprotease [Cellulophaga sp. F20128]
MASLKLHTYLFHLACAFLIIFSTQLQAQHQNSVHATLDETCNEIAIQQEFSYTNNSKDTLDELYFNDWANAYASKNSALAKRFAEEYKKSLHLAKPKERGHTNLISVVDNNHNGLEWTRTKGTDIVKFILNTPLGPNEKITLFITYKVQLPPNKYTTYGYDDEGGYYLKDWYMTPAAYTGNWQLYSNKNLEDLQTDITNTKISFTFPPNLYISSNLDQTKEVIIDYKKTVLFQGTSRKSGEIFLSPEKKFITHITPDLTVETDFSSPKYEEILQGISINKVANFIVKNLGEFPHKKVLVSELDYQKNPLYGINQLPSFIVPYSENFNYELKFLKTTLYTILNESIYVNPRKEKWVTDAIVNYLMITYVNENYPDQKLLGKLSKIWGIRSFELAKMDFNDQYELLSMLTTRKNLGQPLTTSNDSLIKFNQQIANSYKAGLGLAYLSEYIGYNKVAKGIREFYELYRAQPVTAEDFETILKNETEEDISWFFTEFIATNDKIDFKIKKVIKKPDSLEVIIKNKTSANIPISLFGLKNDSVVSKYWITNVKEISTFTIPKNGEDRLVLNYDKKIPEFNQRDNWKSLKGFFSSNKKLRLQFFKDAENPYYNQVFYNPEISFNAYDGLTPTLKLHNKVLLDRPFLFAIAPAYAIKQKSFVGSGKFSVKTYHKNKNLYLSTYSLSASSFHFEKDSRYSTITPSFGLGWRQKNLRANRNQYFFMRYINVFRNFDENLMIDTDPDYSVLNARFIDSNNGMINYFSWFVDAQYAGNFSKVSFDLEYRKLFQNNRQFNLRFFAGKFLRNTTDSNFFSFALDRPTDYLFDYSYLGRSDASGIYSQQIIIAEGGFKSKLENPYANDWITTVNTSTNIWRWIEAYGDLGYIKNKGFNSRFVYDAGIRLNLVTDYFELFLPMYSNNGWEVSQPNYAEKIRFIVTLNPKSLTGLFTRKWF